MSTEQVITMPPEAEELAQNEAAPTDEVDCSAEPGAPSLPAGAELMRKFLAHSPFVGHLGMRLEAIHPDAVRISMPFRPELATTGDLVHGGAITSLVDTAATAAAWSVVEVGQAPRGTTVGLTVDFVAPARGAELTADATVRRRGRQLCFCDVDVADGHGRLVARGLVTYKLGGT
jgi:uncharacterized protein (TIGR00369 family)